MLYLEILFTTVKNNTDIKSLKILGNTFLYTACADDTNFFSKKFGFNKRIAEYNFLIFIVFRFKTKLIEMRSSRDKTTERGKTKCVDLTKNTKKKKKNTKNFLFA